jgi:hypothetical protein
LHSDKAIAVEVIRSTVKKVIAVEVVCLQ